MTPLQQFLETGWLLQSFLYVSSQSVSLNSQYLPAGLKTFAGLFGHSSVVSSAFQRQTYSCPFLLLCRCAVCLQEKDILQLLFIKLRKKNKPPNPKLCHVMSARQGFRLTGQQVQILSDPHRDMWEYHSSSACFTQQHFLSVPILENLLLLDTHQAVNGEFGSSYQICQDL